MASPLSRSANQFAVDFFQSYFQRHGDKYRNLLLCPYLIYHSLAMMLVGAKGSTAQQLMKLMRFPETSAANKRRSSSSRSKSRSSSTSSSNSSLGAAVKSASNQLTNDERRHRGFLLLTEQVLHGNHDFVHLASFIYLDKSIKRAERYKNTLRDYYETKPKKLDFGDVDLTVKTINDDVSRTTENIYSDILSKQEAQKFEKCSLLLVNAVFFRGLWSSNFTDVQERSPFITKSCPPLAPPTESPSASSTTSSTSSQSLTSGQPASTITTDVTMMSKLDYLAVVADKQLDARIIKMPFEASDLCMLLILPNNKQSDSTYLCDRLSSNKIDQIFRDFSQAKSRIVRVSMPIFCIDSGKLSIQSTLVTMGAGDLFDKNKADMSGVSENKQIWLNKILHRCFIICDNRGSITSSNMEKAKRRQAKMIAAAESSAKPTSTGTIEDFVADHPFMYIIVDSITKTILMMGLYTDPRETLEVIHENQLTPEEAHQIYTEGVYRT